MLLESVLENRRCGNFIRIYPGQGSNVYDGFFESARSMNRFLYQCLYGKMLFGEGSDPGKAPSKSHTSENLKLLNQSKITSRPATESKAAKTIVTSDDALIEYLRRLALLTKSVPLDSFKQAWKRSILSFLSNPLWRKSLDLKQPYAFLTPRLYKLLNARLAELKSSREESSMRTTDSIRIKYVDNEERREEALSGYTGHELEHLILTSGQNYAIEFLKSFQGFKGGLLGQMQRSTPQRARSQFASDKTVRKGVLSFEGREEGRGSEGGVPSLAKRKKLYEAAGKNVRSANKNARARIIGESYIGVINVHSTKK